MKKMFLMPAILVSVAMAFTVCGSTPTPTPTPTAIITEVSEIDYTIFTDDEFKVNCYELWHDDVFFGEWKELKGKLARMELFVEDVGQVNVSDWMYSYMWTDLQDRFGVNGIAYQCGVKREPGSMSYVGGVLTLMEGTKYDCSITNTHSGDHLIVYGEIIYAAKNYMTGYNGIVFLPRIIENLGQ